MANFNISYKKTGINEGGYANDPKDHGGETWRGIARNFHPAWEGWPRIDHYKTTADFPTILKNDADLELLVRKFYRLEFWNAIRGDEIFVQTIADQIYDSAVNMGPGTAIKLAQDDAFNLPADIKLKTPMIGQLGIKYGYMDNKTIAKINNAA